MTRVKKAIQIAEYHEGLAKEIAKMWNLSRDGWGGDTRVMTEEQVKQKEAHSENIALYLAVDGEEVVGYCGLSEYKEDIGSLYIPLLNVRPDYQSLKIGKKLLLHALDQTIKLGWPRLDLYTWPGNTKAVPLYKKCGFFWEDRDDVTHLMNFIPQILSTPLLKPVFEELDWYDSSKRVIEVKPDGTKQNGFTFYEYAWENEIRYARVQFEKTGRGMCLIDTDEFLLQLAIDEHEVIEQEQQDFRIRFINKTNLPVRFKVLGSSKERVVYTIDEELIVEEDAVISGSLYIQQGDEPSPWRTHPYLSVQVSIDNQPCELKLGLFPTTPAKFTASYPGNVCFLQKELTFDLEIKNNLKEDTLYSFVFPEDPQVSLVQNEFSISVPAGGRKTFPVPINVKKHGFYRPTIIVIAQKNDGTRLVFEQEISIAFKGMGEKFGGESKDYWHIFNGLSQVNIRKRDLLMTVAKDNKKKQPLAFFPPKLGKPYVNEFSKKKPNSVTWLVEDSSILLKIELESSEKEELFITLMFQLFADGIVEKWVEVENKGTIIHHDIAISSPGFHELEQSYFPLKDSVVHFSENRVLEFGDLLLENITGNWYFSKNKPHPIGVCWSKNSKASPEGWQFVIEDVLGKLEPGSKKTTEKVTISIGAFQNWEDFKAYAEQSTITEMLEVCDEIHLHSHQVINQKSELEISIQSYRNSYLTGHLDISIDDKPFFHHTISPDEEKTTYAFNIETPDLEPISIINGEFRSNGMVTNLEELLLSPTTAKVENRIVPEHSFSVLESDNGCIKLKAAPDYYPGIFSINVKGEEWLDSSFPSLTAKSWWNPWAGGMKTFPSGLTTFSLLKENNTAYPIEVTDSKGNLWGGLAVSTEIHTHSEWKGVHYIQYYLMLPGVPLIATYLDIIKDGGKNLKQEVWNTDFFIGDEDLSSIKMNVSGKTNQYCAGIQELPLHFEIGNYFSSDLKTNHFYLVPSLYHHHLEAYTNKHALQLLFGQTGYLDEVVKKTAPIFMVFDQRILNSTLLKKLRRIQF